MNNEKWPPDHSTSKGYPFDEVKSVTVYPPDERLTEEVSTSPEEEAYVKIGEEQFKHKKVKELALSLQKCDRALAIAEQQIADILHEDPFVPEEFGFELLAEPQTIHDAPVRVWGSKYEEKYSIYRVFGTSYDWILQRKEGDNTFTNIPMYLPCHRIAFAAFTALRVKVEEVKTF